MSTVKERVILVFLRFSCIALMMIAVSLCLPDFRLGGRYLTLLGSAVIAFFGYMFRYLIVMRMAYRKHSTVIYMLTGFSAVAVLFLMKKQYQRAVEFWLILK